MRRRAHSFLFFLTLCVGPGLPSCSLDNPGDPPPEGKIYLPGGLHISQQSADSAARFLYVVNSNFDLRYNAGSLQAYDLTALDEEITETCGDDLGPTCEIEPSDVLADEVLVPSLVTSIASSSDARRLYVTTRTDSDLTVVDVDDGDDEPLSCGDSGDRRCDDAHTTYRDPIASQRRLVVPGEAVGIVAGRAQDFAGEDDPTLEGEYVLVAHRGGEVSLFHDDGSSALELQDVLTLGGPLRPLREPTGITFDPVTRLAYLSVFARETIDIAGKKVLGRVGIAPGATTASLFDNGALSIEGVSLGRDTRGIAMNPLVAGQALVVSRAPNSLMWVDVASALEGNGEGGPTQAVVWRSESIGRGPSRVITGPLGDRTIAIVSCFDGRQIFILDAATAEPISIVHNFSGPFEVALDSVRQRLYVADFRSSVVRVLDLSALVNGASEDVPTARIVATLGHPELVQELQ